MTRSETSSEGTAAPGELYVDCRLLRPGDVLLTRGGSKSSAAIAWWTNGRYSHAAIVVSDTWLFESDDLGVDYTPMDIARVELIDCKNHLLARLGAEQGEVRRHPSLKDEPAEELSAALRDFLRPFHGLEYPKWSALAAASNRGRLANAVMRRVLQLKDWWEQEDLWNPGPYCSQVVALALEAQLPPSQRRARFSSQANPNSFLNRPFRLVEGAVRPADPTAKTNEELLNMLPARPWGQRGAVPSQKRVVSQLKARTEAVGAAMDQYAKTIEGIVSQVQKEHDGPA